MKKNKNEIVYWIFFILILMTISICIILYFRLPKSINYELDNTQFVKENIIIK